MVEQGYAKGRRKRGAIIAEAAALFAEVGYRAASLREISARSGLSHPGLLHHFPTKEALLLAVLDQRDTDDGQVMAAPSSDGRATLRGLLDVVDRNTRRRGIVELFTVLSAESTAADHPAHDYFVERYRSSVDRAESAYADLDRAGQLEPGVEPATAARQLIAVMDGLQVQWLLDEGTDMVGAVRGLIDAQLNGGLDGGKA